MKTIIINNDNQKKEILVLENDKIVEKYQELNENKTIEGNIYIGKVINVLPGMQAAFVDIGEGRNAFLHIKDILPKSSNITGNKNEKLSKSDISKFIKNGMNIVVQVKKDKTQTKGARVSTNLNIPGKYVALIPNAAFVTVSNKIENETEVERLKQIINDSKFLSENGYVIRTAAVDKSEKELIDDIENVNLIYENIKSEINNKNIITKKLYDAGGIVNSILLGLIESTDKIIVNDEETYNYINEKYIAEKNKNILKLDKNYEYSLDVVNQLEKLKNRKIWLKCGGFITIDGTEALTAIDVNTGKYTGNESLEKTILKVNMEASIEIAKQIRARDIGGIIIIDYIDMEEQIDEKKIIDVLENELKKDRAKTQVMEFTKLHLLEMTRKHLCSNE